MEGHGYDFLLYVCGRYTACAMQRQFLLEQIGFMIRREADFGRALNLIRLLGIEKGCD